MGSLHIEVQIPSPDKRLYRHNLIQTGTINLNMIKRPTNIQKIRKRVPIQTQDPITMMRSSRNFNTILNSKITIEHTNMTTSGNSKQLRLFIVPAYIGYFFLDCYGAVFVLGEGGTFAV